MRNVLKRVGKRVMHAPLQYKARDLRESYIDAKNEKNFFFTYEFIIVEPANLI
jgi:hypothetical protein